MATVKELRARLAALGLPTEGKKIHLQARLDEAESVERTVELLAELRGNVSATARALRISRQTLYNRIRANPDLQHALTDARESMLDNAESKLYSEALSGNITALIFFLKTQGYRRGYTERQHLTVSYEDELLLPIRAGDLAFADVAAELGDDLTTELFRKAGRAVAVTEAD